MSNMDFIYMNEDTIDRLLICKLCSKPFTNPVKTKDGNRYCERCITEKLQNDTEELVPIKEKILLDILDNLLVQCSLCQQINIHRINFPQHLNNECSNRIVLCKASDLKCPWNGTYQELDNHMKNCTFELLRPVLNKTIRCEKQLEEYRILTIKQQDEIEELKKQNQQYENRLDKLKRGFKAILELTSQQKLRYDNIQKDLREVQNQFDFKQISNHEIQLQQIQKQEQYRKNEITRIRQISDQHQIQIHLLARKKCVIPSEITPINRGIEQLIESFESNSDINLNNQSIKDTDIELIGKKLIIDKQCRKLRLEKNDISAKGIAILSDTLYGNTNLQELYLSHNHISDMGTHALAQVLSINNWTLEWLELNTNNITDEGIEYLAEMLKTNKRITVLGLSFNRISDRGVRLLANVIACYNESLQWLHLNSNKLITDACVDDLIEMIKQNQTLQALIINDCSLTEYGINKLRKITEINTNFILEL